MSNAVRCSILREMRNFSQVVTDVLSVRDQGRLLCFVCRPVGLHILSWGNFEVCIFCFELSPENSEASFLLLEVERTRFFLTFGTKNGP
jgi:hypothetical protein